MKVFIKKIEEILADLSANGVEVSSLEEGGYSVGKPLIQFEFEASHTPYDVGRVSNIGFSKEKFSIGNNRPEKRLVLNLERWCDDVFFNKNFNLSKVNIIVSCLKKKFVFKNVLVKLKPMEVQVIFWFLLALDFL